MDNVIEIRNLTKFYGRSRGIIDVSFNVKEGEIFGFIGPNGAGKSTTIRTLLSLIFPTSGSALIFGKDCIKKGHEIRKDIGYLPSEVFYYDDMKVIDLLKYSASFYGKADMNRIFKILAALINVIIFNLVTFAVSVFSVRQYTTDTAITGQIFRVMAALMILQLLFLGLGLLLGAAVRKSKTGTSIAATVILAAFMLKVLINLNKDLDKIRFLTPFKYFAANTVMFDKKIDPGFAVLSIMLAAVGIAGSCYFFKKRDLHS